MDSQLFKLPDEILLQVLIHLCTKDLFYLQIAYPDLDKWKHFRDLFALKAKSRQYSICCLLARLNVELGSYSSFFRHIPIHSMVQSLNEIPKGSPISLQKETVYRSEYLLLTEYPNSQTAVQNLIKSINLMGRNYMSSKTLVFLTTAHPNYQSLWYQHQFGPVSRLSLLLDKFKKIILIIQVNICHTLTDDWIINWLRTLTGLKKARVELEPLKSDVLSSELNISTVAESIHHCRCVYCPFYGCWRSPGDHASSTGYCKTDSAISLTIVNGMPTEVTSPYSKRIRFIE